VVWYINDFQGVFCYTLSAMFHRGLFLNGENLRLLGAIEAFLGQNNFVNHNAPDDMVFPGIITTGLETKTGIYWAKSDFDGIFWSVYARAPGNEDQDMTLVWVGIQTGDSEDPSCYLVMKMKMGETDLVYIEDDAAWQIMAKAICTEIDLVDLCMNMMD
jgi:hypothetical protein